jgi:hypothetical protein
MLLPEFTTWRQASNRPRITKGAEVAVFGQDRERPISVYCLEKLLVDTAT